MRCPGAAEVGAVLCRPTRRREAGESCAGEALGRKKAFLDWSGQGIGLQARSESNACRIRTWYCIPKDPPPPGFSSALSPVWMSVRHRAFLVQRQRYKSPQHTGMILVGGMAIQLSGWITEESHCKKIQLNLIPPYIESHDSVLSQIKFLLFHRQYFVIPPLLSWNDIYTQYSLSTCIF